jgi:hypothetical protein
VTLSTHCGPRLLQRTTEHPEQSDAIHLAAPPQAFAIARIGRAIFRGQSRFAANLSLSATGWDYHPLPSPCPAVSAHAPGGLCLARATPARARSPPCRRCGCRTESRRAALATREPRCRRPTARPSRRHRARPGGRMPCTTRSAARELQPHSRASSAAQAEISTGRPPSYQAINKA